MTEVLFARKDEVLNLTGGTMTGLLILSGDPTDNLGAATKQYVDNRYTAGTGIDLTSFVFSLDIDGLTTVVPVLADELAFYDVSGSTHGKTTLTTVNGILDHDALLNFVATEHIDHTAVTLTAGEGLTGGGDISANRSFAFDINSLTTDGTPDLDADYVASYDASAVGHKKVLLRTLRAAIDLTSEVTGDLPFSNIAQIATSSILGRTTAATGDIEVLTGTQATALLDAVVGDSGSGGTKGLVPAPGAGDAAAFKFLMADGAWNAIDLSTSITGVLPLANGGTGANLSDPGADRILFWDDSAGAVTWLSLSGLTISTTTLSVDAATTSASGVVELATTAETVTGTDTGRAVTPAGLDGAKGATRSSFSANKGGTNQTGVSSATFTTITFGTEDFDVGSYFASDAWVPPAGKVAMSAAFAASGTITAGAYCAILIRKNGSGYKQASFSATTNAANCAITIIDDANGTDSYDVQAYITTSSGTATINGTDLQTFFYGWSI